MLVRKNENRAYNRKCISNNVARKFCTRKGASLRKYKQTGMWKEIPRDKHGWEAIFRFDI